MTTKIRMWPHKDELQSFSSGIAQVILHYFKYLPDHGFELVPKDATSYDLTVSHAGARPDGEDNWYPDVHHSHGLLWTSEFNIGGYAWQVNKDMFKSIMGAKEVTVPSEWVAVPFRRDFRINPHIIGHGVDWEDWQHKIVTEDRAIWAKNRKSDGLNPMAISQLAREFPDIQFLTTFKEPGMPDNVISLGNKAIEYKQMQMLVQSSSIFLATDRETWGIGMIEAMAAGVPVLSVDAGAVPDFMKHGESGYCFRGGDIDDAVRGMQYIVDNREILSQNAQHAAKQLPWQLAVEKVAGVYRLAMREEEPTVSIVIPCYNYGERLDGAIRSALAQSYYRVIEIIVVDDGSTDDSVRAVGETWADRDGRLKFFRTENRGVAGARNYGAARASGKAICFLDADDRIEPGFIDRLVPALEADRTLGVSYTGVRVTQEGQPDTVPWDWQTTINPGEEARGRKWPSEWDFDAQVDRINQIPTCCLIRKKAFDRIGGYRSRYCPDGAGSEDAELFLRLGAYGWGAKYVTPKRNALFVHDHGQGNVSGDKAYKEPDWTAWHPWTKDRFHPAPSHATPLGDRASHPVRSYEKPLVSVIIPVGPGHEETLVDALDSLEAQTYRNWEAIVVWDMRIFRPNSTDYTQVEDWVKGFRKAYPYVREYWAGEPEYESWAGHGPGRARNVGVRHAKAPFIAFLDADDYFNPGFLESCIDAFDLTKKIIYTDFVSKLTKEQHAKYKGDIVKKYKKTGEVLVTDQFGDFNRDLAMKRPQGKRPYVWSAISIFMPKLWHEKIHGFDETLETWEDCDYLLRLAWSGYGFYRVDKRLWMYNFSSGQRREKIAGHESELMSLLQDKWDRRFNSGM